MQLLNIKDRKKILKVAEVGGRAGCGKRALKLQKDGNFHAADFSTAATEVRGWCVNILKILRKK